MRIVNFTPRTIIIAKLLDDAINNCYYSQEKLAAKIGITRQHIGLIENGVVAPSVEVAKKLAAVLGFDWTRFYDEYDDNDK